MNRQQQLQKIADEIRACRLCKKGGSGKPVPGEGSAHAPVVFVGEAPGREEARTGRPFVGRSGKFLRQMIREAGMDEQLVFITSPVHYLPDTGKPSPAMIEHGTTHLRKQIAIIRPRVVVLLGTSACRALLGKTVEIAKQHGKTIEQEEMVFFLSFHPAYAIRFPEGREQFTRDFAALRKLITQQQPTFAARSR
jgi:uracil-DNA glycosylase family 4